MPNPRKFSQDPVFPNLLPRDKVVLLRSPLDESDPTKRNGTASLDAVAAALTGRLPGDYLDLSLVDAQALPDADPPGVKPTRLYGISGDWNTAGINATVYVCGVRVDAYHTLGVVYDAQGKGQLVEVDVVAGTYKKLSADDLLSKDNTWLGINDFSNKGMILPLGGFIDETGRISIRQVDVSQKHFTFGRYYSLASDSLIQWKPNQLINQDGAGDVGLARVGPGSLEVNTGTAGDKANLSVLDLLVASVQNLALNTFGKLANAFAPYLGSGNTVTDGNLVIGGSGNTVNGQTSIVASSVATTNSSNLVVAAGLVAATLKNLQPGVASKNLHLKNGTDRESFITLGIGGAGGLVASTSAGLVATPIIVRMRGVYDPSAYYDAGDTVNRDGQIITAKVSRQGSAQRPFDPAEWLNWGISTGPGGGIDYANEVAISNNATADINKAYVLQGAGCTLTLPAAPVGSALFVRVDDTALGLFAIAGIPGNLKMWASESSNFRMTTQGWRKAADFRKMVVTLAMDSNDQRAVTQGTDSTVPVSVVETINGPAALGNSSPNAIRVLRDNYATVGASVILKDVTAGGLYVGYIYRNGVAIAAAPIVVQQLNASNGGALLATGQVSVTTAFAAGDTLTFVIYADFAANYRGQFSGSVARLTYTEQP